MSVVRGCGTRAAGGLYFEVGLGPFGSPIEEFLVDPPVVVDLAALGISPLGQHLVDLQGDGVYHILDFIGTSHYPNVADFVEETRKHGLSRRANPATDFSLLSAESRLVLIHRKAHIKNWDAYNPTFQDCPKHDLGEYPLGHASPEQPHQGMCASLWHQDLIGGIESPDLVNLFRADAPADVRSRFVRKVMPNPGDEYYGWRRPDGVTPHYADAIFLAIKPARLVVVDHEDSDLVERRVAAGQRSGLPVEVVDE